MSERSRILNTLKTNFNPQLIVIGGGITGAGIFLDAQSRGINTILIEKDDFAEGTSSRSTKLIHGGLRYLKQLDFKVVRDTGRERQIVRKIAPHITHEIRVRLPIQREGSLGKFSTKIALMMYEFLANVDEEDEHRKFTKTDLVNEDGLDPVGLKGAYDYLEYQTDDSRLVIENIKKGVEIGGLAINNCQAVSFEHDDKGQIEGLHVVDCLTKEKIYIECPHVISATGPWVDEVCRLEDVSKPDKLTLTKGVHIVFRNSDFPLSNAYYFDTDNGRMIFAIPYQDVTYVGTTDTIYKDKIEDVRVSKADVDYLLKNVNARFTRQLRADQIISSWAGLRPLIQQKGKGPSEISRKDEIFKSDTGLYSIAGGKLTGYRVMANKVLEKVIQHFRIDAEPSWSDELSLSGGAFTADEYNKTFNDLVIKGIELGIDEKQVTFLFSKFGSNSFEVLNNINMYAKQFEAYQSDNCLLGALHYCMEKEFVISPCDFAIRRMGLLYFNPDLLENSKHDILKYMRSYFSWSDEQLRTYLDELNEQIHRSKNFN